MNLAKYKLLWVLTFWAGSLQPDFNASTKLVPSWQQIKQQAQPIEFVNQAGDVYGLPVLMLKSDLNQFIEFKNQLKAFDSGRPAKKLLVKDHLVRPKDLVNLLALMQGRDISEFDLPSLLRMAQLANTLGLEEQALMEKIISEIRSRMAAFIGLRMLY